MAQPRLAGKIAIVTGGGRGIGGAICQVFAREGANVAVLDINGKNANETLRSLEARKGQIHCDIETDISKVDEVKAAFKTAEDKLGGKCNVLVNCAAIFQSQVTFDQTNDSEYDDIMNVNLKGTYLMSKEFITALKDVDADIRGSLINISSVAGAIGVPYNGAYAASKAGVTALTKVISQEFQTHRIRANTVLPGLIGTPLVNAAPKEILRGMLEKVPMGRLAQPEEVANACLFLASYESSFITGASLGVTGGALF